MDGRDKLAIPITVTDWAARSGCAPAPTTTMLPDLDPSDGTTTTEEAYPGCAGSAAVALLRVTGGGHNWPGGHAYGASAGTVARDFNAGERMWPFLSAHPMP
jgi:polyhydroxybutyrate depolymerase